MVVIILQSRGRHSGAMTQLLLEHGAERQGCLSSDRALIVSGSEYSVVSVEQRLERLRMDREAHTYKQIWTKDAHGGPYRKAATKRFDPMLQLPDGTDRQIELGYERVEQGPTTNFVGNHMTQGAIDLVQAELQCPSESHLLLLLEDESAEPSSGPQLLGRLLPVGRGGQQAGAPVLVLPLLHHSWWDGGVAVSVLVDLAHCKEQLGCAPAPGSALQLACHLTRTSMQLQLAWPGPAPAPTAVDDTPPAATLPSVRSMHSVQLTIEPLRHEIQPSRCTVTVGGGPLALPAPLAAPDALATEASIPAPASGSPEEQRCPVTAASNPQQSPCPASPPAAAAADGSAADSCGACTIRRLVPPGAASVVVCLLKADPSLGPWASLRGELAVVQPQQRQQGQSDLTALRRAVRQQRATRGAAASISKLGGERLAPESAALGPQTPRPGSPTPEQARAGTPTVSGEGSRPSLADLLSAARRSMQAGQHQAAVHACTALLQLREEQEGGCWQRPAEPAELPEGSGEGGVEDPAVEVLALRAECHSQMGCLKQAILDLSTALQLCSSQPSTSMAGSPSPATTARLLLARAAAYEQLELYANALQDLKSVAGLQQPAVSSQVALALQRVGRSLRDAERLREREQRAGAGTAQPPSVPRQSKLFSGGPRRLV